jgi:hypothetical protein
MSGNSNFTQVLAFSDIPMCKVVNGLKLLPLFDVLLEDLKDMAKEILEICSRKGDILAMNITFKNSRVLSMFPGGEYLTKIQLFDSIDENIYNITMVNVLFKQ